MKLYFSKGGTLEQYIIYKTAIALNRHVFKKSEPQRLHQSGQNTTAMLISFHRGKRNGELSILTSQF